MKKRILYGLLFISLFVLSTMAVFTQPTVGASWTYGVPDAAKGMTTESEVKVYDKDDWGTHIGYDVDDTVNAWFGGGRTGANDVGAKSKSKIDDWEKDDFWFYIW